MAQKDGFLRRTLKNWVQPTDPNLFGKTGIGLASGVNTQPHPKHLRDQLEMVACHHLAYVCTRKIASSASSVPFYVEDAEGNPQWDHPVSRLLSDPSKEHDLRTFGMLIYASLASTGNAFVLRTDGGRLISRMDERRRRNRNRPEREVTNNILPSDLEFLFPDRVEIQCDQTTGLIDKYFYTRGSARLEFLPEQVIHIRHAWPWHPDNDCVWAVS